MAQEEPSKCSLNCHNGERSSGDVMLSKIDLSDFLEINNSLYSRDTSDRTHSNWYDGFLGAGLISRIYGTELVDKQD